MAQRSDISRRTFTKIGGTALAGLVLGASPWVLGGCSSLQPDPEPSEPSIPPSVADIKGLTPELLRQASSLLNDIVYRTPLVPAPTIGTSGNVMLKLENLQKTGSFKLRGAYAMIAMLSDEERSVGVVTCSAGNHAQGVAYASRAYGIPATIYIPADAPKEKIENTRSYGAEVRLVDGSFDEAKAEAEAFVAASGATYVPPYDDYRIMAGQGTIGLELLEQAGSLDAVVVPVGGGGLIGGIAYALKASNPAIAVYGVEPDVMPSMSASLEAGKPTAVESQPTIADGIHVAKPGDKTFDVASRLVDRVCTVSEKQIAQAIAHLAIKEKVVAEGAGATTVAALLSGALPLGEARNVVCVVSGGNIDPDRLSQLLV